MEVSQNDLVAFHQCHFSADAVANFATKFTNLPPKDQDTSLDDFDGWEDDDDLGFYYDGVKRTLTDEQIAIFRHSELRELKKRQEKAKASDLSADAQSTNAGEAPREEPCQSARAHGSRGVRKKKKKGGRSLVHEPKPDLRKRTWDVVDAGLDSLDYD
ncbi:hypothetical protein E4U41_004819 [Claviceps citrina]|nr:hypothetical protein E4U41_004819 [Claviceps citrina]